MNDILKYQKKLQSSSKKIVLQQECLPFNQFVMFLGDRVNTSSDYWLIYTGGWNYSLHGSFATAITRLLPGGGGGGWGGGRG